MTVKSILLPITKWKHLDVLLVFVVLLPIFWFAVYNIGGDYALHLESIIKVNKGESYYSPHFLFFFLVNMLSGFSSNLVYMYSATVLVLTIATVFKYCITKQLILSYVKGVESAYMSRVVKIAGFGLLISFTIPDFYNFFKLKYMYLGRVPPNVWHNSTLTLLFPFALLLFRQHLINSRIENPQIFSRNTFLLIFLIALNIIIKPSFLFSFFPVMGLIILHDFEFKTYKKSVVQLFPLFIGGMILLGQYFFIYKYQIGSFNKESSSVIIGIPFEFLRNFVPYWYIPIGHFFSFLFPLIAIYHYREILRYRPFVYALLYAIVGLLISIFVNEDGPRKYHGNFTWQNIICMYLLMLAVVMYLFPKLFTKELMSKKMLLLIGVFVLQFLSGILYLLHMYYTGGLFS